MKMLRKSRAQISKEANAIRHRVADIMNSHPDPKDGTFVPVQMSPSRTEWRQRICRCCDYIVRVIHS